MRVTRYLWISNLPDSANEQDIRDALLSHGKIQSIRIRSEDNTRGAIVAFVDTQSASRAIQGTVRLKKVNLSLQYCESSGILASFQESSSIPSEAIPSGSSQVNSMSDFDDHPTGRIHKYAPSRSEKRKTNQSCSRQLSTVDYDSSGSTAGSCHHSEKRGLLVRRLPQRSSDGSLREGLFHEYKKHGKITSVVIRGQAEDRHGIITFKRGEDATRALNLSRGKVFFGTPITISLHDGVDSEDLDLCPPEHALDEYHPKATKTLFVGNLCSVSVTQEKLKNVFRSFGTILEIDVKIQTNQPGSSYAFVQFDDIKSVVRALSTQDNIRVDGCAVKLGFGKSQPTNVVWLDNLPSVSENFLTRQFGRYGHLTHVVLDHKISRALLYFDTVEMAQRALNETKNRTISGRKVQLDFAGYECQVAFMQRVGRSDELAQSYDDYRERIQELLALFPSIPLLGKNKLFDQTKDRHSKDSNHSSSPRRPSLRHLSPSSRTRNGSVAKQKSFHTKSPVRIHAATRNRSHSVEQDDDSNSPDSYQIRPKIKSRSYNRARNDEQSFSKFGERLAAKSYLLSPSVSPGTTKVRHRLNAPIELNKDLFRSGHYLDATDDVSSGSFSSDLESVESTYGHIPKETYSQSPGSHKKQNQSSNGSTHVRKDKTQDKYCTGSKSRSRNQLAIKHEYSTVKSDQCSVRTSDEAIESSNNRTREIVNPSAYPVTHMKHNRPLFYDTAVSGDRTRSIGIKSEDSKPKPLQYCESNQFSSSNDTCKLMSPRHNKSLSSLPGYSQLSDSSGESHDTLTKLEMERAKLLRELSLLNNEVTGSSSILPCDTSRKRRLQEQVDVTVNKSRRRDVNSNSPKVNISASLTSNSTLSHIPERHVSVDRYHKVLPMHLSHQTGDVRPDLFKPPVTTCSPIVSSALSPAFATDVSYSTIMHPSTSTNQSSNVQSMLHSSPRVFISPEPATSNNFLPSSSPLLNPFENKLNHISTGTNIGNKSVHSFSPSANISGSSTRDPRLLAHPSLGEIPPPPPPENLKIPLWIDTSNRIDFMETTQSLPNTSTLNAEEPKVKTVEMEPVRDNNCSLDERIRLLDMQLSKSEKARPAVDYSKFRIKRRGDGNPISSDRPFTTTSAITAVEPDSVPPILSTDSHLLNCSVDLSSLTTVSTVSCNSSLIPSSVSPLPRPADTSDFVKSMLSASKPPVTSFTSSSGVTATFDSSRSAHPRNTDGSHPVPHSQSITQPFNSLSSSFVTHSVTTPISSRSFQVTSSHYFPSSSGIGYNASGLQPIGVATRLPSLNSTVPGKPNADVTVSSPELMLKPLSKKEMDSVSKIPAPTTVAKTQLSTDSKPNSQEGNFTHVSEFKCSQPEPILSRVISQTTAKFDVGLRPSGNSVKTKPSCVKSNSADARTPHKNTPNQPSDGKSSIKTNSKKIVKRCLKLVDLSEDTSGQLFACKSKPASLSVDEKDSKSCIDVRNRKLTVQNRQMKHNICGTTCINDRVQVKRKRNLVNEEKCTKQITQKKTGINKNAEVPKKITPRIKLSSPSSEPRYESMYDKIKRRASKEQGKTRDCSKRQNKSNSTFHPKDHSSPNTNSDIDSDTDECLSYASEDEHVSDEQRKTSHDRSSSSHIKRKKLTQRRKKERTYGHKSNEIKETICKTGKRNTSALRSIGMDIPVSKTIKKKVDATLEQRKQTTKRKFQNTSKATGKISSIELRGEKQFSKEQRHSLVRRVFASSDSETSLSDSDNPNTHISSTYPELVAAAELSSNASSQPTSRSCSPGDLDVGAAVRHTFGAFCSSTSATKANENMDIFSPIKSEASAFRSTDSYATHSKSSPPTLPMLGSADSNNLTNVEQNLSISSVNHSPDLHLDTESSCKVILETSIQSSEFDELPMLEKQDDVCKTSGKLLFVNAGAFEESDENELPPMVSLVDESFSDTNALGAQNDHQVHDPQLDVIEEVVVDELEVPAECTEHKSIPDSCLSEAVYTKPIINLKAPDCPLSINLDSTTMSTDLHGVSEKRVNVSTISTSSNTTEFIDSAPVSQPIFFTVPKSATDPSLNSQPLTMASSIPTCSGKTVISQPRHVTLLLPASSVTLGTSVLPVSNASMVTPTIIYNTSISSPNINPSLCVVPLSSTGQISDTCMSSALSMPMAVDAPLSSSNIDAAIPSHSCTYSSALIHPSSSMSIGSSDFTSYVQRVIERVKQEKDVGPASPRERSKRSKKASINMPICSSDNGILPTPVPAFMLPDNSSNSKSHDTPIKNYPPHLSSIGKEAAFKSDPSVKTSELDPDIDSNETIHNLSKTIDASFRQYDETESRGVPDSVDEVIESVVNGQFNEHDYIPKVLYLTNNELGAHGSVVQVTDSSQPSNHNEATESENCSQLLHSDDVSSSQVEDHVSDNSAAVRSVDSSKLFSPMHVLTLVATGAASPAPTVSNATAVSPGILVHATTSTTSSTTLPVTVSTTSSEFSPTDNSKPTMNYVVKLTASENPILAPQLSYLSTSFDNQMFTKYIVSLLAQQQLNVSPNSLQTETAVGDCFLKYSSTGGNTPAGVDCAVNDKADFIAAVASMANLEAVGVATSKSERCMPAVTPNLSTVPIWSGAPFEIQGYPIVWQGRLSLKNEELFANMHYLSGNQNLIRECLSIQCEIGSSTPPPPLRIAQRMRMEPSQLDGVQRKLRQMNEFCMCLTLASVYSLTPTDPSFLSETAHMNRILCDCFIRYLLEKSAAGIINVSHPVTQQNLFVVHIFPPSEFTRTQLELTTPNLLHQLTQASTPYLLTVVTTV